MQPTSEKISTDRIFSPLESLAEITIPKYTLFSLPLSLIAGIVSTIVTNCQPKISQWFLLSGAIITARTLGMLFNRLIDRDIDKQNPRTWDRSLPSGKISSEIILLSSLLLSSLYLAFSFAISLQCFLIAALSIPFLILYPYCKRFTNLRHFVLGGIHAIGPIASSVALTNQVTAASALLSIAACAWMSSRDLIYSLQDVSFHKEKELYGLTVILSQPQVIFLAAALHVISIAVITMSYQLTSLNSLAYYGPLLAFTSFIYQYSFLYRHGLSKSHEHLFFVDHFTSPILLLFLLFSLFTPI
jgi:4-hydroxybenzoate polyprenyltransferase